MWFKLIATLLSGTGALLPYLSSERQQLLTNNSVFTSPNNKWVAWLLFTLCQTAAIYFLNTGYSVLVSSLTILTQLMCYWILLTLTASHHRGQPIQAVALVFGMGICIAILGAPLEH
jgi:hypothetical protein